MTTTISTRAAGTLNPTRRQLDELDALLQRMLELPVHPLEEPDSEESEEATYETAVSEPPPPPQVIRAKEMRPAAPPVSYMVVETASPRPLPPASGFETRSAPPTPRSKATPNTETPITPPAPEPGQGEMWVPLRSTWQPSAQTWPPLAESWHQANSAPQPLAAIPESRLHPLPATMPVEHCPAAAEEPPATPPSQSTAAEEHPAENAASSPVPPAPAAEPLLSLTAADAPVAAPWPLLPLLWFNQGFDACLAPLGAFGGWLCGPGRQLFGLIGLACLVAAAIVAASIGLGWNWIAPLIE